MIVNLNEENSRKNNGKWIRFDAIPACDLKYRQTQQRWRVYGSGGIIAIGLARPKGPPLEAGRAKAR